MDSLNRTTFIADSTDDLRLDLAELFVHDHFIVPREPDTSYQELIQTAKKTITLKEKIDAMDGSLHFLYQ